MSKIKSFDLMQLMTNYFSIQHQLNDIINDTVSLDVVDRVDESIKQGVWLYGTGIVTEVYETTRSKTGIRQEAL